MSTTNSSSVEQIHLIKPFSSRKLQYIIEGKDYYGNSKIDEDQKNLQAIINYYNNGTEEDYNKEDLDYFNKTTKLTKLTKLTDKDKDEYMNKLVDTYIHEYVFFQMVPYFKNNKEYNKYTHISNTSPPDDSYYQTLYISHSNSIYQIFGKKLRIYFETTFQSATNIHIIRSNNKRIEEEETSLNKRISELINDNSNQIQSRLDILMNHLNSLPTGKKIELQLKLQKLRSRLQKEDENIQLLEKANKDIMITLDKLNLDKTNTIKTKREGKEKNEMLNEVNQKLANNLKKLRANENKISRIENNIAEIESIESTYISQLNLENDEMYRTEEQKIKALAADNLNKNIQAAQLKFSERKNDILSGNTVNNVSDYMGRQPDKTYVDILVDNKLSRIPYINDFSNEINTQLKIDGLSFENNDYVLSNKELKQIEKDKIELYKRNLILKNTPEAQVQLSNIDRGRKYIFGAETSRNMLYRLLNSMQTRINILKCIDGEKQYKTVLQNVTRGFLDYYLSIMNLVFDAKFTKSENIEFFESDLGYYYGTSIILYSNLFDVLVNEMDSNWVLYTKKITELYQFPLMDYFFLELKPILDIYFNMNSSMNIRSFAKINDICDDLIDVLLSLISKYLDRNALLEKPNNNDIAELNIKNFLAKTLHCKNTILNKMKNIDQNLLEHINNHCQFPGRDERKPIKDYLVFYIETLYSQLTPPIKNTPTITKVNKELFVGDKSYKFMNVFDNTISNDMMLSYLAINNMIANYNGVVFTTFGVSGVGKTFTLFGKDSKRGLFQNLVESIWNIDTMHLNIYELYGIGYPEESYWNNYTGNKSNNEFEIIISYKLVHQPGADTIIINKDEFEVYSDYATFVANKNSFAIQSTGSKNIKQINYAKLSDDVETIRRNGHSHPSIKGLRTIKPTYNNKRSSRSTIIYEFKFLINGVYVPFVIIDLPGREKILDTYKLAALKSKDTPRKLLERYNIDNDIFHTKANPNKNLSYENRISDDIENVKEWVERLLILADNDFNFKIFLSTGITIQTKDSNRVIDMYMEKEIPCITEKYQLILNQINKYAIKEKKYSILFAEFNEAFAHMSDIAIDAIGGVFDQSKMLDGPELTEKNKATLKKNRIRNLKTLLFVRIISTILYVTNSNYLYEAFTEPKKNIDIVKTYSYSNPNPNSDKKFSNKFTAIQNLANNLDQSKKRSKGVVVANEANYNYNYRVNDLFNPTIFLDNELTQKERENISEMKLSLSDVTEEICEGYYINENINILSYYLCKEFKGQNSCMYNQQNNALFDDYSESKIYHKPENHEKSLIIQLFKDLRSEKVEEKQRVTILPATKVFSFFIVSNFYNNDFLYDKILQGYTFKDGNKIVDTYETFLINNQGGLIENFKDIL